MSAAAVWGAEQITVRFGGLTALDRVSVTAAAGQVTVVVGGDGAGKSTLLRCMAGALAPAEGTVRRPGARRIGYLPPSTGVYEDLSVTENLQFRSAIYKTPAAGIGVGEYLERTGLASARDRLAGRLSGGMRRKLGVIAAMLPGPGLLVLDEPTTGVDPVSRADLWWLIARAAAGGAAVLMSTTYFDEAARAARVLVLDAGRVLAAGTPGEITSSVPGRIVTVPERPAGEAERRRAWRRAGAWRVWQPDGSGLYGSRQSDSGSYDTGSYDTGLYGSRAQPVTPDLQDAVCVAALRRELSRELGDG